MTVDSPSLDLSHKFTFLPDAQFRFQKDKDVLQNLHKWGLLDMQFLKFKSDRALNKEEESSFMDAFFSSDALRLALPSRSHCTNVDCKQLTTKHTTLALFRPLETAEIVSANSGRIAGRLEEDYGDILLVDRLRECLVCEESEIFPIFTAADRSEFLFHILRVLVLGGEMNQYEEFIAAYFHTTKVLYRDLVSVRKNASNDLYVVSHIYHFSNKTIGTGYLISDPLTRELVLWLL